MPSRPQMSRVPISPGYSSNVALGMYFLFKLVPALGGILSIYLGYRLFILGVTGQASLSVESKTISGQLLNAAPGLFFAIGGIITLISVVFRSASVDFGKNGRLMLNVQTKLTEEDRRLMRERVERSQSSPSKESVRK